MNTQKHLSALKNTGCLLKLFKMMREKRGLSAVVATVLLILLSVSAVVVIARFIIPFVNRGLEGTSCFEYRDYFKFDESFGFDCYKENSGVYTYILTIKPRADNTGAENVRGFGLKFMMEGGGTTANFIEGASPGSGIEMFNGGNIRIPVSGGTSSVLSYNYTAGSKYTKVEIYPILKEDKICDTSDSTKLSKCG